MSELQVNEHIDMSIEEYTKRYNDRKKSDLISKALAILKLAAHNEINTNYEGELCAF